MQAQEKFTTTNGEWWKKKPLAVLLPFDGFSTLSLNEVIRIITI
jgi:hypothetical protein